MSKVVKFPSESVASRFGLKRVRRRKGKTPEDFGQMNLFEQNQPSGKVVQFTTGKTFEEALTFDEQGNHEAALQAYRQAIKHGDRIADAYCNLGILKSRNNSIDAIDCFTRSLKAAPRHFQSHYNLANLYSEEKNYALAKLHYEVAIQIVPDFPNAYYNLGLVLALMKEYQPAIEALTVFKKLAPPNELGNTNELIESLTRSLTE
jgi:tetratricopeptide (TPR) repeat protein